MPHSNNIIKKINIGGTVYEIHDEQAIHDLSDIEALGLEGAFIFKGIVPTVADLPNPSTAELKVGYVYHVSADSQEYVWTTENKWESFGSHLTIEHTHNVTVTGGNSSSSVTGSAQVSGTNSASNVTASGSVSVPKVTKSANYIKAAPSTSTVTGVSGSVTASKATAGTAIAVAKVGTAVSIPNVTANTSVTASKVKTAGSAGSKGSAATWSATVTDGTLSFSFTANTPTTPATIPTFEDVTASNTTLGTAISVTPAASAGNITPYTFENVTVPKAATSATTIVTGVSLEEGTSTDGVLVGDTVAISSETKTVDVTGTAAAQTWTQDSGVVTGTAAAQTWTQASGTTGKPVQN